MLEYTYEEAKDLLTSKVASAKTSLKNTIEDLEFLRDQITTMEVSILFLSPENHRLIRKLSALVLSSLTFHYYYSYRYRKSVQLGRQAATIGTGTSSILDTHQQLLDLIKRPFFFQKRADVVDYCIGVRAAEVFDPGTEFMPKFRHRNAQVHTVRYSLWAIREMSSRLFGNVIALISTLFLAHSAYSTYERA